MQTLNTDISQVRRLLEELEDPFTIFPLQEVIRSHGDLLAETREQFLSRQDPYGVARKYWDVPSELIYEQEGHILGAIFVLGQVALTQTVSIVLHLHRLHGANSTLPSSKGEILELDAEYDKHSGLSKLVIIDTAANYFKHRHEWPSDWNEYDHQLVKNRTIGNAVKLSMVSGDFTEDLHRALSQVHVNGTDLFPITHVIQSWRERLAQRMYKLLGIHNLDAGL